ncbi:MAG TPA: Asp-tRNA(Asn)/Glu-tRNA(Gln) amidotransferase GatCAB subunit B, partial [Candidatus Polarisedimenticolia bacterium]
RRGLPELPAARRTRFVRDYGLKDQSAQVLTSSIPLADYFEAAAKASGDGQGSANWVETEVLRKLNELKIPIERAPLSPGRLGALVRLIKDGAISGKIAKEVFEAVFESGGDPEALVRERGLTQVSDEGAIKQAVEKVVAANQAQVAQYKAGKTALIGFFVGQVLKAMKGQANPTIVNRLVKEHLERP